ncbi:hypothetical protein JXR93_10530 [bacterium]|nr:hypothetical protein [bacterium]
MNAKVKMQDLIDIPNNFNYGLELYKEYLVMGILTFKDTNELYYLIDENGFPSWFPNQIFEITNNELPIDWFIKINTSNDYLSYKNLIGFDELCNNEDFFYDLLERDKKVLQIYYKRKIELEKKLTSQ